MEGKVLIINGSMPHRQAHLGIYLRLLDKKHIPYDIICWNRKGDDISKLSDNYIVYDRPTDDAYPSWKKTIECFHFANFVRKEVRNKQYNFAIVFTIVTALFSILLLTRKFKYRYVFDIRDWSPVVGIPILNTLLKRLIHYSKMTCISSGGFLSWLPKEYNYIVSHNIDERKLNIQNEITLNCSDCIRILTIGYLRDAEANSEVIQALGNNQNYELQFVGDGLAVPYLKNYCEKHTINNVFFHGYYQKEVEDDFIAKCDLMNIFLPNNMLSNHLMTNRFYLSVLFRKPMIVNDGCYQADIVSKYKLGVIIKKQFDIKEQIDDYISTFNSIEYETGCKAFLDFVKAQNEEFHSEIYNSLTQQ